MVAVAKVKFQRMAGCFLLVFLIAMMAGCGKSSPEILNAKLLRACEDGKDSEVASLLDQGANPNTIDANEARKFTPLVVAIEHPSTVSLLLKKGAKADLPDGNGIVPLDYAASAGAIEIMKLLLANGADPNPKSGSSSPLSSAAGLGELDAAKLLVANGANVNFRADGTGFTPLHEAIMSPLAQPRARVEMIQLLVAKGADIHAKDRGGLTPLDWAENSAIMRKHEKTDLVAILKKADAQK